MPINYLAKNAIFVSYVCIACFIHYFAHFSIIITAILTAILVAILIAEHHLPFYTKHAQSLQELIAKLLTIRTCQAL
ncbi:hypothetical protein HMPREF1586_00687 [Gardnerella vaginalis JCP8522]|nr:hypothetical protein HMPREF1586_00687 [Gardnerella vaginalis JCP8522]